MISEVVCGYSCYFYILRIPTYIRTSSNLLLTLTETKIGDNTIMLYYTVSKLIITKWVHV